MRYVGLSLLALAVAATAAPAQSSDWPNKMFGKAGTSHDFGTVAYGAKLYKRVPITNIWAVPIDIVNVRVSCGCVTALASTASLKPRESGYLDLTMDALKFKGQKSVTVYVTIGPEYTGTASFIVSANSRQDIVFNPGQVNFGVVQAGQTPTQNIDVDYAGVFDWQVKEVIKNDAPLDVTFEKRADVDLQPGQVRYRVKVTLKPDAPAGTNKWELVLKTNDPAGAHVPVLVEATIQAALSVAPNTVNMQALKVGDTATQRIVVRGNKPFKITSIKGTDADLSVEAPTTAAQNHILTVKCRPSQAGEFSRKLQIETELGTETVTIMGTVNPKE
jgi:hypothetical protein